MAVTKTVTPPEAVGIKPCWCGNFDNVKMIVTHTKVFIYCSVCGKEAIGSPPCNTLNEVRKVAEKWNRMVAPPDCCTVMSKAIHFRDIVRDTNGVYLRGSNTKRLVYCPWCGSGQQ